MINKLNQKDIEKIIENKTVAFVCPSKCITGSQQREFIESHDLIVRINRQHPVPKNLIEDIGERTDLLYNSNLGDTSDNLAENLNDGNLDDVKCICYPEDSKVTEDLENMFNDYPKKISCFAWPYKLTLEMMKQAKSWGIKCPNQQHDFFVGHTGTIALYHVLRCNPKKVYITGMTFYREPYFDGYKEKGHKPSKEEQNQIWDKWNNNITPKKLHNIDMDAEVEFFKRLKKECNIENDAFMERILG